MTNVSSQKNILSWSYVNYFQAEVPNISQFVAQEAVHTLIKIMSLEVQMGKPVWSLNDHSAPSLSPGMAAELPVFCSSLAKAGGAADVI